MSLMQHIFALWLIAHLAWAALVLQRELQRSRTTFCGIASRSGDNVSNASRGNL
jgi:hypothetical protein